MNGQGARTGRMRTALRSLLWLATGFVLVVAMIKAQPNYDEKRAPLLQTGALKQPVRARNFTVNVHGFRLARTYTVAGDALFSGPPVRTLRTPGVWMSVVARVEALQEPGYVTARLRTRDGYYYTANSGARPHVPGVNLSEAELSVGLPQSGAYFFELPPDQVAGAHIQFYWGLLQPPDMDSLLDIDLETGRMSPQDVQTRTTDNIDLRP